MDGNTAGEFSQSFLKFFPVVITASVFNLGLNLGNPFFKIGSFTFTVDDGCVLFFNLNRLGLSQAWRARRFPV